jgi:deoxyribonuclease-4
VSGQLVAPRLRLGAHVSIAGGLERAALRGAESGCDVIQIFTRSNQQWAARPIGSDAAERWRTALAATGVDAAMVHGCYLVNLACPRARLRERSYRALAQELRRCALLGIRYLVIHPGAHGGDGEAAGVARIAAALDRLHAEQPDNPTRVLLENTAGQGNSVGHRFEHLRDILAGLRQPDRVGLCIDTCHTLAAGYDIRNQDGWYATFERLNAAVGCDRVAAFHVNDSKTPLGSRVDRHEHLGRGHLGLAGLRCLVNDARFAGLPMVIETPKPTEQADLVNLAILRALDGRTRVGTRARQLAESPFQAFPAGPTEHRPAQSAGPTEHRPAQSSR